MRVNNEGRMDCRAAAVGAAGDRLVVHSNCLGRDLVRRRWPHLRTDRPGSGSRRERAESRSTGDCRASPNRPGHRRRCCRHNRCCCRSTDCALRRPPFRSPLAPPLDCPAAQWPKTDPSMEASVRPGPLYTLGTGRSGNRAENPTES